jgi:hypothetical protein
MVCNFQNSCKTFFDFLAGEWLLKLFKANGGTVIALRAIWITAVFAGFSMMAVSAFDPARVGPISWSGTVNVFWEISSNVTIFLGASYLALYARFVSQWSYLAGLYNLIKQAEAANGADKKVISEWKAGYLEDAENLHLAAKNNLAPVLHAWVKDPSVVNAYIENTPGGASRLQELKCLASHAFKEEEAKWKKG